MHFNENKPENKNILLTNKRDNKIKIFCGGKWIFKDKDQTINDLMDGKYFILDSHFENICNYLDKHDKNIYTKFSKDLITQIKK